MAKTLLGVFADEADANQVILGLEDMGYPSKEISFISQENKRQAVADLNDADPVSGAASGAVTGTAVGGLAGLLAGVGVIPAIAGLLIGGPITAALGLTGIAATTASGAITGAVAGGLIGALTHLGLSEEDARYYDETIKKGGVALAVTTKDDDVTEVKDLMAENNAERVKEVDLDARTEATASGATDVDA
jgi:hypothetical protein